MDCDFFGSVDMISRYSNITMMGFFTAPGNFMNLSISQKEIPYLTNLTQRRCSYSFLLISLNFRNFLEAGKFLSEDIQTILSIVFTFVKHKSFQSTFSIVQWVHSARNRTLYI